MWFTEAPPPQADNSDVLFIAGKTDHLSRAPKYTKPSGGEARLLIGPFQVGKTLKIAHFTVEVKPKGMEIWKFRGGRVHKKRGRSRLSVFPQLLAAEIHLWRQQMMKHRLFIITFLAV